MDQRIIPTDWN